MEQSQVTTVKSLIKYLEKYHDQSDVIAYTGIDRHSIRDWGLERGERIPETDCLEIVTNFPDYAPSLREIVEEQIDDQLEKGVGL
tara:strand:- start:2250 stop:2504 length:255 start_codon:yes stop_codon:yes gene_type:complete